MDAQIRERLIKEAIRVGVTDSYQHDVMFDEESDIAILKGRGIGMTKAVLVGKLYKAIFPQYFPNAQTECGVMSDVDDKAQQVIDTYVRDIYRKFYKGKTKVKIINDKTGYAKFSTGAFIKALPCKASAARSLHGDFVGDEIAFYKNGEDEGVMTAVQGMQTTGGQCTLLTTGYGERGAFYKLWKDKDSGFKKYLLPYTVCKRELYLKSVEKSRKKMLPLEFAQEFLGEFMPEGSRIIPFEVYASCVNTSLTWGEEFIPKIGSNYVMGIDFGRYTDKTVIVILEVGDRLVTAYVKVFHDVKFSRQLDFIVYLNSICPNLMAIYVDKTTVGIKLFEDLEDRIGSKVIGVNFSVPTKEGLFQGFKTALMDKTIELPPEGVIYVKENEKGLKDQIIGMRKTITDMGNNHYEGDEDDIFWAFSLAVKAAPTIKFTEFVSGIIKREETSALARLQTKPVSSRFQGMFPQRQERTGGDFGRPKI